MTFLMFQKFNFLVISFTILVNRNGFFYLLRFNIKANMP